MKVVRTVSEADLGRLKQERHEADRRYNEALTGLDAAIVALPPLPEPPPSPDEAQITPLNERWDITRALPPLPGGWRGRLAGFVLSLIQPALEQQQAFNSALVDHINRNASAQRSMPQSVAAVIAALRQRTDHLTEIESRLVVYLQQVTPFVDTKDYEFHGLATRIAEDVAEAHDQLARTVTGLAAALSGVSDDVLKRWERYEGLRSSLASMQLTVQALRRELAAGVGRGDGSRARAGDEGRDAARRAGDAGAEAPALRTPAPALPTRDPALRTPAPALPTPDPALRTPDPALGTFTPPAAVTPSQALSTDPLSSHKYVAFEDLFRGNRALIRERQRDYVKLFAGREDVLDVGCGRGEFLQLLLEAGISGRGVDSNHEMAAQCTSAGLDVTESDVLSYLQRLPDGALGGLIAMQVVEHLEPDYLLAFLDDAFRVLRPGSPIVLETINVTSWSAFFTSYLRDLTHVRPIHPETLQFVVTASGFLDSEIQWRAPLPASEKLLTAPAPTREVDLARTGPEGRGLLALADAFDRNVERLNRQLYGPLDYVVIGWRH